MVLTRALVHWFRQSRHPSLSASEPSNDAASDHHQSADNVQSPAAFSSLLPGVLSSLLPSQFGSHSSLSDHTATSSSYSPLYTESLPLPSQTPVTRTSFTPAQLSSLLRRSPPSRLNAVPRPLPTFTSLRGCVFHSSSSHAVCDLFPVKAALRGSYKADNN